MRINDTFTNLVAQLGTARDKASHGEFTRPTYDRTQEYLIAFEHAWLPRRMVSQVSQDCTRKWRGWQADPKQITLIERLEKKLDARNIFEEAYEDARLRGVAYVYISVKGDETRVSEPLNPERVRKDGINHLTRLTRDDVAEGDIDLDPISPTYGKPRYYEIASTFLTQVHPSRFIIFYGDKRPLRFTTGVEANSVLAASWDAIKRYYSTVANVASLVYEARVDVITVPGLGDMLADPDEEARLMQRFALMAQMKGNNGLVMLNGSASPDTPSEKWEQKNTTFATLPDIIEKAQEEVSAAARIPRAILFGTGAGGLGATGDLELSAYYDYINTLQKNDIEPAISVFDECLIRAALGTRPDDIWYQWDSLWQMSDRDKADIGNLIADKWNKLSAHLPIEVIADSIVNDLTESGVGGGVEQFYNDWRNAGGAMEPDLDANEDENDDNPATP
jgi:uncharacterized protein